MPQHTLYAYVDGSDLHEIASGVISQLEAFVDGADWPRRTWVVDRRHEDPSAGSTDLPDWDLGLNHELPDPGREQPGWFEPIEHLAVRVGSVAEATGRDFVVGVADAASGLATDVIRIKGPDVDLGALKRALGELPHEEAS